eukprot:CAMPEP_0179837922 /NCGR_PEP_ID=MMETSP0982-20121206/348_1 /TAXON_ID=483367 /ORGANISM="non described non described, Strain CCMP 2436" /LENGTH=197 /DNA_ID=CAMNT_0021721153 /DNA_START=59 /DNA_END=653 /DNA_ORIENTATION=+
MPSMANFRYVRILDHRRVFGHMSPSSSATLEISSLSAEVCAGASFCGVAFDILTSEWPAFVAREDEYILAPSRFVALAGGEGGEGMLCTRASDQMLQERGVWPRYLSSLELLPELVPRTCWEWGQGSGLRPCPTYLRHCLLSSRRAGVPDAVRQSFLADSYLVDRETSLEAYLAQVGIEEYVMSCLPPKGLETRYGG